MSELEKIYVSPLGWVTKTTIFESTNINLPYYGSSLESYIEYLKTFTDRLSNVTIDVDTNRGYYDEIDVTITVNGERPADAGEQLLIERAWEKEEAKLESNKKKAAAAAERAKASKAAKELKLYQKLQKKYGDKNG